MLLFPEVSSTQGCSTSRWLLHFDLGSAAKGLLPLPKRSGQRHPRTAKPGPGAGTAGAAALAAPLPPVLSSPPSVPKPILTREWGSPLPGCFNQSFPQQMKFLQEGLQVLRLGEEDTMAGPAGACCYGKEGELEGPGAPGELLGLGHIYRSQTAV